MEGEICLKDIVIIFAQSIFLYQLYVIQNKFIGQICINSSSTVLPVRKVHLLDNFAGLVSKQSCIVYSPYDHVSGKGQVSSQHLTAVRLVHQLVHYLEVTSTLAPRRRSEASQQPGHTQSLKVLVTLVSTQSLRV